MVKNITIALIFWLFFHLGMEPDYLALSSRLIEYVAAQQTALIGWGLLGGGLLIAVSYLCFAFNLYLVMFLLAKVFFELAQFAVSFVSVSSLILWFAAQRNVWTEVPAAIYLISYIALGASALSLRIFDFNYPLKERVVGHALLPLIATGVTLLAPLVF